MSDPILSTFRLSRPPFSKDLSTEALWLDERRSEAVRTLLTAVSQRQHALVIGEPGVGKTTNLRALREQLSPVHFRCHYLAFVTLSPRDFNRQLCRALELDVKATAPAMFNALQQQVLQLHREHRIHPVIVIDEAQLMPDRTLAHLHVLANFDWDSQPLMSLVLVGLPELHSRLKLGVHRSLLTRIAAKVEVTPATVEQTAAYVRQRLADAGAKTDLFTPDALALLHEFTGGILRCVDILATAALQLAALQDIHLVDRPVVVRAHRNTPLA